MKNINSEEYLIRLEVFSIALSNGLISKSKIIKWADKILIEIPNPDYLIIELSLLENKSTNEIISTLNNYLKYKTHKISGRIILGMLYKLYNNKQISFRKVLDTINWLFWNANLSEEENSTLDNFDFLYELAENKILGSFENLKKQVLLFLENYKEFDIENQNNWEIINKSIENKLIKKLL